MSPIDPGPADATEVVRDAAGATSRRVREFRLVGPEGEVRVVSPRFRIGSHPGNDLVLRDPTVSRFHLELEAEHLGYRVRDLESTNGTSVNGVRVLDAVLPAAATLRLGQVTLQFRLTPDRVSLPTHTRAEFFGLLGRSALMRELFSTLERVAPTDATVLIEGESGTGKERVAEAIHRASRRADGPFVVVDCAVVPLSLVESELFGHERGAFTGAVSRAEGRFREADGSTLFLDEIGELPPEIQPKLLRALESRQVRSIGGTRTESVNVRVLAATNRDLGREVNRGSFREDLYYRLAVVRLKVPPLRDRPEDLRPLVRHFIEKALTAEPGRPQEVLGGISEDNWRALESLPWPGNVRELRNLVERTLILSGGLADGLGEAAAAGAAQVRGEPSLAGAPVDLERSFSELKAEVVARFEQTYLEGQLARHGNNLSAAARASGLDRMNFKRLLKRYR
jgi:two-component system, NtrC family, response regulator GlrR